MKLDDPGQQAAEIEALKAENATVRELLRETEQEQEALLEHRTG